MVHHCRFGCCANAAESRGRLILVRPRFHESFRSVVTLRSETQSRNLIAAPRQKTLVRGLRRHLPVETRHSGLVAMADVRVHRQVRPLGGGATRPSSKDLEETLQE